MNRSEYPAGSGALWTYRELQIWGAPRRAIVGSVLAAAIIIGAIWQAAALKVDDGFTQFVPTADLFPDPPVADAVSTLGTGRPASWPTWIGYSDPLSPDSTFSRGWQSMRHDWIEDGTPRSWIISERAVGYTDLAEFDARLRDFREYVEYRGWRYDGGVGDSGYNARLTELNGLPGEAFAFAIDASPGNRDFPDSYGDSNPDDFHGFGAVLPGRQRGQMMWVSWIGWGADVPTDEFVATARRLLDAAENTAAATDEMVYDSAELPSDLFYTYPEFVGYQPGPDSVPAPVDTSSTPSESEVFPGDFLAARRCWGDYLTQEIKREAEWPENATWEQVDRSSANTARSVIFASARPRDDVDYRHTADRFKRWTSVPCVDTFQNSSTIIEPIELAGLPAGTVVAKWHQADGALSAVLTDDATHAIMIVAWQELPGPVPTDEFVDVVNEAWEQFIADNPASE